MIPPRNIPASINPARMALTGAWHPITHLPSHPRSSHTLSILQSSLHLFSGSSEPTVASSPELHILPLNPAIPIAITVLASPLSPPPRIGAASIVLDDTLYIFGGRSGSELEEQGRLWSFIAGGHSWASLDAADPSAPFPEPRSGHTMAAAAGRIYVHGGCTGAEILRDLWRFDVELKRWERLADAPGELRAGVGIVVTGGRELWRVGGITGGVDVYDIPSATWRSISCSGGPQTRSGSCLVPVTNAQSGAVYLVTLFGEATGSGGFLDEVWAYNIASAEWSEVGVSGVGPAPRVHFATVAFGQGVVVQGGVDEENKTLGDWWLLGFD